MRKAAAVARLLRQRLRPDTRNPAWWLRAAILLIAYVAGGKFGLGLAAINASATAVWPPTGIALVALLLLDIGLWPAVLVGAFIVNVTTTGGIASSMGIAVGNALEAVLGALLVNRFANGARAVERAQDLVKLALLTGLVSAPIAATIGATTLALTGYAPWYDFDSIWTTWWLGDAVGVWLFAPLLLSWTVGSSVVWTRARVGEAALVFATLVVVAEAVFGGLGFAGGTALPFEFLSIPVLLWAAFRLGPRETTTAMFILSVIALRGTLHDIGPFSHMARNDALVTLQTFLGVLSITKAAVAALVQEQRRAEERGQAFNRDLESRVKARTEALARSEDRLIEAQRVAHIGSWEWDVGADQLWWSDELRRILGVDNTTAIHRYGTFLDRVHADDRPLVETTISRALADGRPFAFEHRIVRPDGEVRVLDGRGHVVVDSAGRAVLLTGTGQDVTDWKRLEAERAEFFREQAARREAEQANRLKDAFLATLSHELRTPLNAILGWLQILRGRHLEITIRRAIDVLDRNATALRRLIEDMLDVSAILSGKLHMRREAVDFASVVDGVVDSLRPSAAAKRITLQRLGQKTPVIVDGDSQRLGQVVTNLISNALKFTAADGLIEVELACPDPSVVLSVRDTGAGISPESLPFIFDAFRQADASLTRAQGGLGLGLAIVREVVDLHGGIVRAANRPGLPGAEFTVTLPLSRSLEKQPAVDVPPADVRPALEGLRVLAVDDDADSRDVLSALFESAGASFLGVHSALEGLKACESHQPDLLLVDLAMPDLDGYAFIRRIRDMGVRVPAIAITAYVDEEHRAQAFAAGFDAHLPKPLAFEQLLRTVAMVVGRSLV